MSDEKVIRWLELKVEGSRVYKREAQREGWKDCWIWYLAGGKSVGLLDAVIPYLVGKKEQAFLLQDFVSVQRGRRTRKYTADEQEKIDRIVLAMGELNRKGTVR